MLTKSIAKLCISFAFTLISISYTQVSAGNEKGTSSQEETKETHQTSQTEQQLKDNLSKYISENGPAQMKDLVPKSLTLHGKRWIANKIWGWGDVTLDNIQKNQNVYIYKCAYTSFIIPNKVPHIVHLEVDQCSSVNIQCPSVISSIELSNCTNTTIICKKLDTIQLDNVHGCTIYLPSDVADRINIFHSKCKDIKIVRVVKKNKQTYSQSLIVPTREVPSDTQEVAQQYLTRIEKDDLSSWTNEGGNLKKGKLFRNGNGELLFMKYVETDKKGNSLIPVFVCHKTEKGNYTLTDRGLESIQVKRYKREGGILIRDADGDWIQITRNTQLLKDSQGYTILPENIYVSIITDPTKIEELIQELIEALEERDQSKSYFN